MIVTLLTILNVLIHKHEMPLHLLRCSLISFNSVLQYSEYKNCTFLVRYIPNYFNLFDAILNRIIFLIVFSVCLSIKCVEI